MTFGKHGILALVCALLATLQCFSALAAGEQYELKIRLLPDQVTLAQEKLAAALDESTQAKIFLVDASGSLLNQNGVYLRLRVYEDGTYDTNAKIKPLSVADVSDEWLDTKNFKCEVNYTVNNVYSSCAFKNEYENFEEGWAPIEYFSKGQIRFLEKYRPSVLNHLNTEKLSLSKAILAEIRKYEVDGFKKDVVLEKWTMPDGREFVELSTKVEKNAEQSFNRFFKFVTERLGLKYDPEPDSRLSDLF